MTWPCWQCEAKRRFAIVRLLKCNEVGGDIATEVNGGVGDNDIEDQKPFNAAVGWIEVNYRKRHAWVTGSHCSQLAKR